MNCYRDKVYAQRDGLVPGRERRREGHNDLMAGSCSGGPECPVVFFLKDVLEKIGLRPIMSMDVREGRGYPHSHRKRIAGIPLY